MQNTAARVIAGARKHQHITPILKQLHWLPICRRIEFKLLILTYRALYGQTPEYLTDLLKWYNPRRSLHSGSKQLFMVPKTRLKTFGDTAFSVHAPVLWNRLPGYLRAEMSFDAFKSGLKTYLFKLHYN